MNHQTTWKIWIGATWTMVSFDVVFSAVISILIVTCLVAGISFLWEMKKVPKDTDIDDTIHIWSALVMGFCICALLSIVLLVLAYIFAPYDLLLNNLLILLVFFVLYKLLHKSIRRRVRDALDMDGDD